MSVDCLLEVQLFEAGKSCRSPQCSTDAVAVARIRASGRVSGGSRSHSLLETTIPQPPVSALPSSLRRVNRVDDIKRCMHGYIAHATINRRRHQIYCSDLRYGSSEKALAAAQKAVSASLSEHDLYLALRRRHNRRQNTPGDIPGVNRVPRRPTENVPNYWVALWPNDNGKRSSRKFSVAKFTEQGAYERALETRLAATVADRHMLRTLKETTETFSLVIGLS